MGGNRVEGERVEKVKRRGDTEARLGESGITQFQSINDV